MGFFSQDVEPEQKTLDSIMLLQGMVHFNACKSIACLVKNGVDFNQLDPFKVWSIGFKIVFNPFVINPIDLTWIIRAQCEISGTYKFSKIFFK